MSTIMECEFLESAEKFSTSYGIIRFSKRVTFTAYNVHSQFAVVIEIKCD
jgi:hypothetical protein